MWDLFFPMLTREKVLGETPAKCHVQSSAGRKEEASHVSPPPVEPASNLSLLFGAHLAPVTFLVRHFWVGLR